MIMNYLEMDVDTVLGNVHVTTNDCSHTILVRGLDGVSKHMTIPM